MAIASPTHISRQSAKQISSKPDKQASNFANDYFDFKKGADREDRLGPERAVAQGWITPKAMLAGTFVLLGLACLSVCGQPYPAGSPGNY